MVHHQIFSYIIQIFTHVCVISL